MTCTVATMMKIKMKFFQPDTSPKSSPLSIINAPVTSIDGYQNSMNNPDSTTSLIFKQKSVFSKETSRTASTSMYGQKNQPKFFFSNFWRTPSKDQCWKREESKRIFQQIALSVKSSTWLVLALKRSKSWFKIMCLRSRKSSSMPLLMTNSSSFSIFKELSMTMKEPK